MKKLLFLTVFTLFSTFYSYSQYMGGGGFCIDCYSSIEVGANTSNISGLEGAESKLGFYIGFYQYRYLSESFSLRYGASYNNLGAKIKGYDDPIVIHGINFPLSVHYTYQNQFQGFLGGELGTNFFGSLPEYESSDPFDQTFEFQDTFTLFDASIFVGVGYIIAEHIDINLKYNYGVTNISQSPEEDWKKNWLTLSVGYTFRD